MPIIKYVGALPFTVSGHTLILNRGQVLPRRPSLKKKKKLFKTFRREEKHREERERERGGERKWKVCLAWKMIVYNLLKAKGLHKPS